GGAVLRGGGRSYARVCFVCERWKIGMLLLLGSPPVSIGLALEAGVSARESTNFSDIHAERAVRFPDDPIVPHAITRPPVLVITQVRLSEPGKSARQGRSRHARRPRPRGGRCRRGPSTAPACWPAKPE